MAHSSYFRSVINDNFKILTWVLILFIAITPNFIFINSAYASAAEKWDYEVDPIPDTNQRVVVTGHKVDQYGDAINDSKYKTTIDPKTLPNKQKMGGVAIAKLLKKANWASAGVEAFQALLEGIDWVIDPQSQSIWRYKQGSNNYSCSYITNSGGNSLIKVFNGGNGETSYCPYDMALSRLQERSTWTNYQGKTLTFVEWNPVITSDSTTFRFLFKVVTNASGYTTHEYLSLSYTEEPHNPSFEKEYLTPETASDYANKTHPDYNNPAYKPNLDLNYKPEIVPNLWKPHNEWEKINSPTVQEVERQLEQANPTSQDKDIEQKTDEQGNPTGAFTLPEFCSWATPVCEFIKWFKQEPEQQDDGEIQIDDQSIIFDDSQRITFANSCPMPEQFSVSFFGASQDLEFSYQPLCDFMTMIKPFVIAGSYLIGAYIVMGLSRGSGD